MAPKLRGRGLYVERHANAIDRFRRAYGALTDDDGATEVALPGDTLPALTNLTTATGDVIGHFQTVGVIAIVVACLTLALYSCSGGHPAYALVMP